MGSLRWVGDNWVVIVNAVGVVAGLFFTAFAVRAEAKTRRIANLLDITTNHREIWKEFLEHPQLARILDPDAGLGNRSVTVEEEVFVTMVILHLSSVFYAMRDELVIKLDGLRRDAHWFFSLPIAREVWEKRKSVQNEDFVDFVEQCRERSSVLPGLKSQTHE